MIEYSNTAVEWQTYKYQASLYYWPIVSFWNVSLFLPHALLCSLPLSAFRNSIAASAVCAFNLSAIAQVFRGPFKFQENSRSAWLPYPNPNPDFQVKVIM